MVPELIIGKIVCVVGLGYVGYPLAEAFSRHVYTIGYDVDVQKIEIINSSKSLIHATNDPHQIQNADVIMVCVPTPVTKAKDPDLTAVRTASMMVGQNIKPGAIVVLESTVFPGATEEILIPILECESGMRCGVDFFVGYSPERINPNDNDHTIDRITKIVSGMDEKTTDILAALYGLITNVYRAPDIRTAEAAKVIENIQRDLNIALVNELALIFSRLGLDTRDVLDAAGTKWNFHRYSPGLVGGHCIPVDPYYLVQKAEELGYHPQVILAGRAINDSMPGHVARLMIKGLNEVKKVIHGSKVLIMGLTYKEDVPDIRESPVGGIICELKEYKCEVYGYDPLLTEQMIMQLGVIPLQNLNQKMDGVIIAVAHQKFKEMSIQEIRELMLENPVLVDVRGMINRSQAEKAGMYYQKL
jgi:UDPglucose 6-dehydrogenase/UDP-N-acetyl-D-galactosamine dehydrogenase